MATFTTHLKLGLDTLGDFLFKKSYADSMVVLDSTIGDVAGVTTIEGDSVAEKLEALEARLAAVE